jgi:lysozyme
MIHGIDISSYNTLLDLKQAKAGGIEFAFVKTSEGAGYVSAGFEKRYSDCIKAGLKVGFYHFAKGKPAELEARHFLNCVETGIEQADGVAPNFPLVLDIEDEKITQTGFAFDAWIETFKKELKNAGYQMWLYSYTPYINKRTAGQIFNIPYWAAAYPYDYVSNKKILDAKLAAFIASDFQNKKVALPKGVSEYVCWQYTGKGTVKGIKGNVDLNIMPDKIFNNY